VRAIPATAIHSAATDVISSFFTPPETGMIPEAEWVAVALPRDGLEIPLVANSAS
jgi:hypothetical protein